MEIPFSIRLILISGELFSVSLIQIKSILIVITEEAMAAVYICGNTNFNSLPIPLVWKYMFLTFLLEHQNGTRLSTDYSAIFLNHGKANL
jgi:hypothetical protein